MELPVSFLDNMKKLLGEGEYQAYLESFKQERVYGLRVNTQKISPEQFEAICPFAIQKIPWIPNGYYYAGTKDKPAKDPYYFAGLYYLQEPSAMTPANVLPIEPGDRVLDLCAAPGGKSTELAARLKGEGVLVSNDISNSRAKALLKNLELFGIPNAFITSEAPHKLAQSFSGYFDKILIDAPCSGEGMFRKEPAVMKSWEEHGNGFYVSLQKEIAAYALKMLRPGGMLLYSTCTFSPLEDEQMVQYMLDMDKTLSLVEPEWYEGFDHGHPEWTDSRNPELAKCVRIWPHKMKGEGHFLALLKKQGGMLSSAALVDHRIDKIQKTNKSGKLEKVSAFAAAKKNQDTLPKELEEFLKQIKPPIAHEKVQLREEKASYPPICETMGKGLRILRSGLLLGECKKNRFEPSQALAMALKMEQYPNCFNLDREDIRVVKYLKGETIEADYAMKGWVLICVNGYPLGFGKASGTSIKNKYLAGWRWM